MALHGVYFWVLKRMRNEPLQPQVYIDRHLFFYWNLQFLRWPKDATKFMLCAIGLYAATIQLADLFL